MNSPIPLQVDTMLSEPGNQPVGEGFRADVSFALDQKRSVDLIGKSGFNGTSVLAPKDIGISSPNAR